MALDARPTFRLLVDWDDDGTFTGDVFPDAGAILISTGVRLDLTSFDARPVNASGSIELNNVNGQYDAEPGRPELRRPHACTLVAEYGSGLEATLWTGRLLPPQPGFGVRSVLAVSDLTTHVEYETELSGALTGTYDNAMSLWQAVVPSAWQSSTNVFPAHLLGYVDWPQGTNLRGFIDLYREATDCYVIEDFAGQLSVFGPRAMQAQPIDIDLSTVDYLLDDRYIAYPQAALVRNRVNASGRRVVYGAQTASGDVAENQSEVVHEREVSVGSVIDFRYRGEILGFRNESIVTTVPSDIPTLPDTEATGVGTARLLYMEFADGEIRGRYSVSAPEGVPLPSPPPTVRVSVLAEVARVYTQWEVDNSSPLSVTEFGERSWDAGNWHHPQGLSWTNVAYALDRRDGVLEDPPLSYLQLTVPLWQSDEQRLEQVMTKIYQGSVVALNGIDYLVLGRVLQIQDGVRIPRVELQCLELRRVYNSESLLFDVSKFGEDMIFPGDGFIFGVSEFGDPF